MNTKSKSSQISSLFSKGATKLLLVIIAILLLANLISKEGLFAGLNLSNLKQVTIPSIQPTPVPTKDELQIQAVKQFYSDISSKQFDQAWGLLTKNSQNYSKNFDNFVKGYSTTKSDSVQDAHIQDSSTNTVYIKHQSVDDFHGQDQTKTFSGTWKLIQEDGQWKLDTASITLLSLVPDLVDCPVADKCGGGTQQITQKGCSTVVCCQTKKDQWQIVSSKSTCNDAYNQPSDRSITAATKVYTYLKLANDPSVKDVKADDFIQQYARQLNWNPSLLTEAETLLTTLEAIMQAKAAQPQYYAPQMPLQLPPINFHPYTQPTLYAPTPYIPSMRVTNCMDTGVGFSCTTY